METTMLFIHYFFNYSIRCTVTSGNSCINESKCPSSLFRFYLMTMLT